MEIGLINISGIKIKQSMEIFFKKLFNNKKQQTNETEQKYHNYFMIELNKTTNVVTYIHIVNKPKETPYGYSITMDRHKKKICSVKPLTKNKTENILMNCSKNKYYKDVTAMDWLSVKNILAKI